MTQGIVVLLHMSDLCTLRLVSIACNLCDGYIIMYLQLFSRVNTQLSNSLNQGGIFISEVTHHSFLMCAAPFASTVTERAAKVTLVLKLFCKFFRDFDNIIKGQGYIL